MPAVVGGRCDPRFALVREEAITVRQLLSHPSSFLSNDFYGPAPSQYMIQAVVVDPCITWTNRQRACYNGTLKSGFSGLTGL